MFKLKRSDTPKESKSRFFKSSSRKLSNDTRIRDLERQVSNLDDRVKCLSQTSPMRLLEKARDDASTLRSKLESLHEKVDPNSLHKVEALLESVETSIDFMFEQINLRQSRATSGNLWLLEVDTGNLGGIIHLNVQDGYTFDDVEEEVCKTLRIARGKHESVLDLREGDRKLRNNEYLTVLSGNKISARRKYEPSRIDLSDQLLVIAQDLRSAFLRSAKLDKNGERDLRTVFSRNFPVRRDRYGQLYVSVSQFKQSMMQIVQDMTEAEADAILTLIDVNDEGKISETEFRDFVLEENTKSAVPRSAEVENEIESQDIELFVEDLCQTIVTCITNSARQQRQSLSAFVSSLQTRLCKNPDSPMTKSQFSRILRHIGLDLGSDKITSFFQHMGMNYNDGTTFPEFISFIGLDEEINQSSIAPQERQSRKRPTPSHKQILATRQDVQNCIMEEAKAQGVEEFSKTEIRAVFQEFDQDRNGTLSEDDFRHALSLLGMEAMPASSVSTLLNMFDIGDNQLDYREFTRFACTQNYVYNRNNLINESTSGYESVDIAEEQLKLAITDGINEKETELCDLFQEVGGFEDRWVTVDEIEVIFDKIGIDLSSAQFQLLTDKFDRNRDYTIMLEDFCSFVGVDMNIINPPDVEILDRIAELSLAIRATVQEGLTTNVALSRSRHMKRNTRFVAPFKRFDRQRNGTLNCSDFSRALKLLPGQKVEQVRINIYMVNYRIKQIHNYVTCSFLL